MTIDDPIMDLLIRQAGEPDGYQPWHPRVQMYLRLDTTTSSVILEQ